jgi:hypothetical protein
VASLGLGFGRLAPSGPIQRPETHQPAGPTACLFSSQEWIEKHDNEDPASVGVKVPIGKGKFVKAY